MAAIREETLSGWGRYRPASCQTLRPRTPGDCAGLLPGEGPVISRGLGRSYGDSAVVAGGRVMLTDWLNCLLELDETTGLLRAEAGATLEDIIEAVRPKGWFLPTTPGTKFVTLGGAIAADVHGKNHHCDGTFGSWIRSITLLLADGGTRTVSETEDAELFRATIGGMGLTGHILEATLQLRRVPSAYYKVDYVRCADLHEVLRQLEATEKQYRYSVGWIDCLGKGEHLGRSVLMLGNDAEVADLPEARRTAPYDVPAKRKLGVPIDFPGFALNSLSVRAFNALYYAKQKNRHEVVDYDTYFYPLDGINNWNRIYGRRGFIQYQALFPPETAPEGLQLVLEKLAAYGLASFLAVIKRSGVANRCPLSYLFKGYTLALDIPNAGERMQRMTHELDEILLARGGRLYLAKDSLMNPETFARMYPRKAEFLAVKRRVDPEERFTSAQARRVGLTLK